jgi:hypothetical protein
MKYSFNPERSRSGMAYLLVVSAASLTSDTAVAAEGVGKASLVNPDLRYSAPAEHYVVLKRGPTEVVIVDNGAVDDDVLPGHRSGYSGVASLKHSNRQENLFVPAYAGLHFQHIHRSPNAHSRRRTQRDERSPAAFHRP